MSADQWRSGIPMIGHFFTASTERSRRLAIASLPPAAAMISGMSTAGTIGSQTAIGKKKIPDLLL
ncbi:MAG: hypothetical protein V3S87_13655 [Alphaproteobacteria bacterium]